MMRFAGNLFAARQDGFDVVELHGGGAAFVALDDAGDHLADQFVVFVVQSVPFGLANLLDHHLLGRLGADPADGFFRVQRNAVVGATDRTVFAVDLDDDVLVFAVLLLGGRNQRRLDRLEDDFLVDVLVAMDRIDDPQDFIGVHIVTITGPFGGRFELSVRRRRRV